MLGTGLWPVIALSNIAQRFCCIGILFMNRHNGRKKHKLHFLQDLSAYLGVTEPALFGVNVKYVYPFVAGLIRSGLAGLISTWLNITANLQLVSVELPGIFAIKAQCLRYHFTFAMAVAIAIPFVLTFFFR